MKTSIFDMTLTLPPLVEMTEVEKDMPMGTAANMTVCQTTAAACGCVDPA